MTKKHGKMIVSVVAVAAMTAALALTASAASNLPEIATSAEIPTAATVIDGPALEGINWLQPPGRPLFRSHPTWVTPSLSAPMVRQWLTETPTPPCSL